MISPSAISPLNRRVVEGVGFTGLLDDYSGAAAAYSVRRLSSNYTGALMEVRRTVLSTTVTADVAYDSNNELSLDSEITVTGGSSSATNLGEFVAATGYSDPDSLGSGQDTFVRTWYDQSGNGNDAEQTTTSSQPQIVNSGSLNVINTKPVINKVNQTSELNFSNIAANYWGFSVINNNASNSILFSNTTNIYNLVASPTASAGINSGIVDYYKNSSTYSPANRLEIYNDFLNTQTLISLTHNQIINTIGYPDTNFGMYNFQECIIYETNQSSNRIGIETNINDYFSI